MYVENAQGNKILKSFINKKISFFFSRKKEIEKGVLMLRRYCRDRYTKKKVSKFKSCLKLILNFQCAIYTWH